MMDSHLRPITEPVRRRLALALLGALLLLLLPGVVPAAAHSLRVESEPAAGAMLAGTPAQVTITFGEAPDAALSRIDVRDAAGRSVVAGPVVVVPGHADTLAVPLASTGEGVFSVTWTAISATDGHVATGTFAYGVGVAPPATDDPDAGTAAPLGPGLVLGGWLLSLGLAGLLGAGVLTVAVTRGPWSGAVPFLAGAWWVAIVGAAIVAQAQLVDAGVSAGSVLTSSLGPAIAGRTLPLGVVAAGIVLVWRRPGRMRNGALVIVVGASAGMLGVAAASHAADPSRSALAMAAQWLHLLAVGVWLGGLAALLVALAAAPGEARGRWARRFSGIALGGLGVVALTGVVRAADEVGSLDALLQTDYGRLVLAKAALLLLLAALGMVQRRRGIPMAASGARTLRRVGSLEVAVAVVAVLLAATLVNLVPPVSAGAVETGGQAEPWTGPRAAAGQDATGSMHATLRLSPGTAGFDTFLLDVADAAGAPVSDASVELWFVPATRPTQPPAVLRLDTAGEGRYLGRGTQLSTEGTWQVTAQVAREGSTAEVPLMVRTAIPVQRIDVVHTPGLPDISSVHLVGGGTLQVYVDPGRAGDNEVHATFFDTSGGELPVTQAWIAVMPSVAAPGSTSGPTSGPSGGPVAPPPPVELSARVLEPGHLVASTRLPAGDAWIVVSAEAPDGASLSAQVPVSVVP